ncbi:nucleoside-diphosphate-sugar epimerase [Kibdelosporangium banguiense]|uniref:Nucleoside-diphosphate-sugar epimerase n=1 Tax=Kibdelosporangium banguiense TaxID=1365924 RepID=A0ABS4TQ02_9PSEU|nr:hypothetical protein [Kibdelosporangium banguiense]MBP2326030.1 nucleoside-diphosphate-sugar epimerase [Kibdelosporangium banguiense]
MVRLPATVHGKGDHGFVPELISIARATGVSGYLGDGSNHWPAVHRYDAARLFTAALQQAPAGARFHGVAEEGVLLRDIAEVIGRHLRLRVRAIAPEDAAGHFGWLAGFLAASVVASSVLTQKQLGWHPGEIELIPDLDEGHYFQDR